MAERAADLAPSASSSVTEAEVYDYNEKDGVDSSFVKVNTPGDVEQGDDVERAELLPAEHEKPAPAKPDNSTRTAVIWMVVNTLATIGIVSLRRFWSFEM
jgi:solute carrier family 35, member E3